MSTPTPEASGEPLSMADLAKGLEAYVVAMGGLHEDDCPGDDTCECAWAPANDAANAACRFFARAASLPAAQGGDVAALREKLKAILGITAFNSGGYSQIESLATDALAALDVRLSPPQAVEPLCKCGVPRDAHAEYGCSLWEADEPVPPPQGAPERKPFHLDVSKDWCVTMAKLEAQGAPEASVDLEQLAWKTAQSIMNDLDIDSEMETRSVADFILAALQRARETGAKA